SSAAKSSSYVEPRTPSSAAASAVRSGRVDATATSLAPSSPSTLRACTVPIPPRPATPILSIRPFPPLTRPHGLCQRRNRLRNRLRPSREVTLADVAEYAGVSASTASRALNGRGELSPETRAAVLQAADALHFEPSHLARSLRTRTTSTIGFVVPDVSSPFYASALQGAQRVLEQAGYRVLLMDSGQDADGEAAALRTLLAHRVDGLLVATAGID